MEEGGSEPRRDVARIFSRARNWDLGEEVPWSLALPASHVTPTLVAAGRLDVIKCWQRAPQVRVNPPFSRAHSGWHRQTRYED